jgi:CRP-like cAMP-binding protein
MTFLEGDTRSATAKALTEVKALIVDTEQREKLLGSVPDWLRALIKDLSLNLRRLNMEYTDLKSENEELKERLRRLEALSRREV